MAGGPVSGWPNAITLPRLMEQCWHRSLLEGEAQGRAMVSCTGGNLFLADRPVPARPSSPLWISETEAARQHNRQITGSFAALPDHPNAQMAEYVDPADHRPRRGGWHRC
jgi:hypothetical protein